MDLPSPCCPWLGSLGCFRLLLLKAVQPCFNMQATLTFVTGLPPFSNSLLPTFKGFCSS
jgi:hypothetical protein